MEGKKISFGFMKTKKADKPIPENNVDKRDYIECVEEQSIKIVGGEKLLSNKPLIIPMKPNSLITSERLKEIAIKVESALEESSIKTEQSVNDSKPDPLAENETLDQMAVRELMQDAKKEVIMENPAMTIPTLTKGVADGENESTLDDYEAVPIQDFGVAMLRGMGWTPGQMGITYKQPELRPKGLGLGADKVIKAKQEPSKDSKQEEMVILKNSYVKIVFGKYSDYYGKVVSLDEENGRVVVDIPLKKETVSLTEFMMHAVTKSEYDRESKVINAESYEEYKKQESSQKPSKQVEKKTSYLKEDGKERDRKEEKENARRDEKERRYEKGKDERERDRRNDRERNERQIERREGREREKEDRHTENNGSRRRKEKESANGNSKNRYRRDSSSSEDRSKSKKKNKKRYSSSDSLSSLSEDDRKHHKHSKNKSRRRSRSRSDSDTKSPTPEAKRDIDKKRKGKKKKRDRDRSPHYRKHRK